MKKHNFNAGPSILPDVVLQNAAKAIIDFNGSGLSLLSISHRTKDFEDVLNEAQQLFRELLSIPDNYKIFFVGGGASTQFFHIPANFLKTKAGYVNTGVWSKKAIKEAKHYGEVQVVATSEDRNFTYIPKGFEIPTDLDYLYICTNNTIYGSEYKVDIDSPVPLFADMSSDILSRPVDVSKYALIYGGAQKNLAPAGLTFVIIRDDMLEKVVRELPTMMNVNTHVDNNSMFNTPPVFQIYVLNETLKWIKSLGGINEMYRINLEKANILYDEIDRNTLFRGTVEKEDRSLMNICFVMADGYEELAPEFMEFAKARGMVGIKGHRLVGGFRASCYNACPKESVEALVACMQEFEQTVKSR
ncbi:MAG: 3-phosphoserine/phosphohydroxythreonine transaminase [Alistipes sp.]|nr:3-phosphoserine/phosphohydroxythreonine transaminase [Alistipes sp.]